MPVDRPTFSESWYRVADLRPRLRSTVQVRRQHFRGQTWHVVTDPANNQFFRLSDNAYHFVGMLDGRRTVAEVWKVCNERLGDGSPTQGEAIQLLGQLYASNLLQAELPPDTEGLFRRYQRRIRREVQGYLMNLLFVRIPVYDPDRFLDAFVKVFGLAFTWVGFVVWLVLMGAGLYFLAGRWGELARGAGSVLDPSNLPLLYVGTIVVKIFHEFGHAFACKKFGRQTGSGGEVHVMGVMFLVFTPLPYVDASSAWAFRSKWHRIVVGAAGMLVELAIAAVAAMFWAGTSQGAVHAIAYNVMLVASVSTVLFNGNPLLRYDGYYILSDLLEIPNLSQRGKEYLYYLVKRHVWGVRQARDPTHTPGERAWMLCYSVASAIYRVIVCVAILLFVADKLFLVGAVLAAAAAVAWVCVPLGKFLHYLVSSNELFRVRGRAALTSTAAFAVIIAGVGLLRVPDRTRAQGVVEPVRLAVVHAAEDGFVRDYLPSGQAVAPDGAVLVEMTDPDLSARRAGLLAARRSLEKQRSKAFAKDDQPAFQAYSAQIDAVTEQVDWIEGQLSAMSIRSPVAGTWIAPDIDRAAGAYLRRGDRLGLVASLDALVIRAIAPNDVAGVLIAEAAPAVELCVEGRPDLKLAGTIEKILPAGQERLPSAALGYAAGGAVATAADDREGVRTTERFFEVRIAPDPSSAVRLMSGQRVVVRFKMADKPLAAQWYRSLLQLIQKRFHA